MGKERVKVPRWSATVKVGMPKLVSHVIVFHDGVLHLETGNLGLEDLKPFYIGVCFSYPVSEYLKEIRWKKL